MATASKIDAILLPPTEAAFDPITFSVIRNRFEAIGQEMTLAMEQTAWTSVIALARDYSCMIYDAHCQRTASGHHGRLPAHPLQQHSDSADGNRLRVWRRYPRRRRVYVERSLSGQHPYPGPGDGPAGLRGRQAGVLDRGARPPARYRRYRGVEHRARGQDHLPGGHRHSADQAGRPRGRAPRYCRTVSLECALPGRPARRPARPARGLRGGPQGSDRAMRTVRP